MGFGDRSRSYGLLSDGDHDRLLVGCRLRLDMRRIALHEDEQAALGAGMFERDRHQGFDQPVEKDLAGYSLRGLDDRLSVQLFGRRADRGCGRGRDRMLAEVWME